VWVVNGGWGAVWWRTHRGKRLDSHAASLSALWELSARAAKFGIDDLCIERPMTIEISQETETRLTDEARRCGVSVDTLLRRLIEERTALTHPASVRPELPVWHLGGVGALHRRDIYDDAD
jgi:hypothetical protein